MAGVVDGYNVRMLEIREEPHFSQKTDLADLRDRVHVQNLDCDRPLETEVLCKENSRKGSLAEFTFEPVVT